MGTRGPKNNWPILGQPEQLHSWFEAAHYCIDFLFYCGEFYSQIYTFIFANYSCPQKIIPYIWGPWTDTQMIQSCIHSPLPCLPSKTKSRQIHGLLFLPKSAHQKLFPYIWGPWTDTQMIQSCIHFSFPCLPSGTKTGKSIGCHSCQDLLAKNYSSISRLLVYSHT